MSEVAPGRGASRGNVPVSAWCCPVQKGDPLGATPALGPPQVAVPTPQTLFEAHGLAATKGLGARRAAPLPPDASPSQNRRCCACPPQSHCCAVLSPSSPCAWGLFQPQSLGLRPQFPGVWPQFPGVRPQFSGVRPQFLSSVSPGGWCKAESRQGLDGALGVLACVWGDAEWGRGSLVLG